MASLKSKWKKGNGPHVLSDLEVLKIHELAKQGKSMRDIARQIGRSDSCVKLILIGKRHRLIWLEINKDAGNAKLDL